MELDELKKRYAEHEKKFGLPDYKEMNDDFEIDKIDRDSDTFLRVIRKVMMEKIVNSMGFVDMLLNPVNAPRIYYSYIKSMSSEDKKIIEKIYSFLADISVASLALEIDSDDKKEAVLIKRTFQGWKAHKKEFEKIIANMNKPNSNIKKEKTYFG